MKDIKPALQIEGESSFTLFKRKRTTSSGLIKLDYTFVFEVSQKTEDLYLLEPIKIFFNNKGSLFTERRTHEISRFIISNINPCSI